MTGERLQHIPIADAYPRIHFGVRNGYLHDFFAYHLDQFFSQGHPFVKTAIPGKHLLRC
jgi:hypothetical protein